MDGNEVSEDVIESHLSCFDDSGSDAGCEGDFSWWDGGVDVDVDAPGRTACARAWHMPVNASCIHDAQHETRKVTHLKIILRVSALSLSTDQVPRIRWTGRRLVHGRGYASTEVLPATRRLAQHALTRFAFLAFLLPDGLPFRARLLRLLTLLGRPPTPFRYMRFVLLFPDIFRRLWLAGIGWHGYWNV